nr:hypothetical protein [Tanacetum cinerariifolium]
MTLKINHEWYERLPTLVEEIEEVVAHSKKIMDPEKQEETAYTNKENNGEVAEEKEPENGGDTLKTELLLLINSFMVGVIPSRKRMLPQRVT